jgi:hypothetical protein
LTKEELAVVLADHKLWLEEAGGKRANLYGAKLDFADLSGVNLSGASLNATNLHRANLSTADLSGVDFNGANLYATDLTRANLNGASFYDAHITRTKFNGADLSNAKFEGARLEANRKVIKLLRRATRGDGEEFFLWHCHEGFYVKCQQMILTIDEALPFWEDRKKAETMDILDMFRNACIAATGGKDD